MARQHRLFAALYDRLTASTERNGLGELRRQLIGPVRGHVVELGAGTGANLEHYGAVESLLLIEPDAAMVRRLRRRVDAHPQLRAQIRTNTLERAALPDASVDAVVCTLVLCSVTDPGPLLAEVQRILRPHGSLVLIEHVRSDHRATAMAQRLLTPAQRLVAGGCHLDRATAAILQRAGFDISEVSATDALGGRPLFAAIAGHARPRGAVR